MKPTAQAFLSRSVSQEPQDQTEHTFFCSRLKLIAIVYHYSFLKVNNACDFYYSYHRTQSDSPGTRQAISRAEP